MASTLLAYRQWAAKQAGRFYTGAFAGSGGTTTAAACTALISSLSADGLLADYWVYLPAASGNDKVRIVSAFTASTGLITVDRPWSLATVPNGKTFELHGVVRPFGDDLTEGADWTSLINDALKRCWVEWEISLTPTQGAQRHDVTTANTWLTEPWQVRQVGYLGSSETRAGTDPYIGRRVSGYPEQVGGIVYLNHQGRTFNPTTDTVYVKCIRSAYDLCRPSAGTFGAQSGLALETDEAIPGVEWVGYGALVDLASRQGMGLAEEAETRISQRRGEWAKGFTKYAARATSMLPVQTFVQSQRYWIRRGWRGH